MQRAPSRYFLALARTSFLRRRVPLGLAGLASVVLGAVAVAVAGLVTRSFNAPPLRAEFGGTFSGHDLSGRTVVVHLFTGHDRWNGWLYREGLDQPRLAWTTGTNAPWKMQFLNFRRANPAESPVATVSSATEPRRLTAILKGAESEESALVELQLVSEHLSIRRRSGVSLGRYGGTKEFHAQIPQLPAGAPFYELVSYEITRTCLEHAEAFTKDIAAHWKEVGEGDYRTAMSRSRWPEYWQVRLLQTNLVSLMVFSLPETGSSGNPSRFRGENFAWIGGALQRLELTGLMVPGKDWESELRRRCVPKLAEIGARIPEGILEAAVSLEQFTLSPTGLQLYFNPYILGSGAEGAFIVHFDYGELLDLLRTNGPAITIPSLAPNSPPLR